jgi:(p)ppGpp synthase/HD superfamily hydrolase
VRRGGHDIRTVLARLPKTEAAIRYAEKVHAGQVRRADGAPFILHPLEVAGLLYGAHARDEVVAAGVLHDVLEKTDADASELRRHFGHSVTTLVLAVSEDSEIRGYARRKAALRDQVSLAGREAMMVFAADKISKVRELALEAPATSAARPRSPKSRQRRLAHYRSCLSMLQDRMPKSPLVKRLAAELDQVPVAVAPALAV